MSLTTFNVPFEASRKEFALFTNYTNNLIENSNQNSTKFPWNVERTNKPKVFSPVVIYNNTSHKSPSALTEKTSLTFTPPVFQSNQLLPAATTNDLITTEKGDTPYYDSIKRNAHASCVTSFTSPSRVNSEHFVTKDFSDLLKWRDYKTPWQGTPTYEFQDTYNKYQLYNHQSGDTTMAPTLFPSAFHTPQKSESVKYQQINSCIRSNYSQNVSYQVESQINTLLDGHALGLPSSSFQSGLPISGAFLSPNNNPSTYFSSGNNNNNNHHHDIFVSETNAVFETKIFSQKQMHVTNSVNLLQSKHPGSLGKSKETGHNPTTRSRSKKTIPCNSANRPFKCHCGRSFARNEELTRHERIHSGYKPHRCLVCLKMFGRKDHLNKHVKTHLHSSEKKVHLCEMPNCGQSYTRSDALARHQMNSHGLKAKPSKWRPHAQTAA